MTSPVIAALAAASFCLQVTPPAADGHRAAKHHARPHGHGGKAPHGDRQGVPPTPVPAPAPDGPVNVPIEGDGRFDEDHEADEAPDTADLVAPQGQTPLTNVGSAAPAPQPGAGPADSNTRASAPAPVSSHAPSAHDLNAATRFGVWHPQPPAPGTVGTAFAQAAITGGGTIVGTSSSTSVYQAGLALRGAYVVHPKVFVALDLELGGGGGTAPGTDRVAFNAGAAAGLVLPLHPRLVALPSLGLGYNLWYAEGPGRARLGYVKHALQLDLRAGLASPITPRWSMVVTPYLQPNLVHGGGGPTDGLHLSLGLSAGVVCWL